MTPKDLAVLAKAKLEKAGYEFMGQKHHLITCYDGTLAAYGLFRGSKNGKTVYATALLLADGTLNGNVTFRTRCQVRHDESEINRIERPVRRGRISQVDVCYAQAEAAMSP